MMNLKIFILTFKVILISLYIVNCQLYDELMKKGNYGAEQQINEKEKIKTSTLNKNFDNLPDLFSNEKLPNSQQETNRCFDLLGCIQTFPIGSHEPQEAEKIQFIVKLYKRELNFSTEILFEKHRICLDDENNSNLEDEKSCQIYPFDLSLLLNSNFNPKLRTIIIIPGYRSQAETDWQIDLKDRWLRLENVNVLTINWNGGNQGLYETAVANTKLVSRLITVLLYYLAKLNNLNLIDESYSEKFVFIGHSLGSHIAGFVGKDFNGSIGRITGLDPAGPEFNNIIKLFRLDKNDAQLVDVIHSNGCPLSVAKPCFGIEKSIGHLDYFANDGKHQPQCKFDALGCSHGASIDYYRSFLDHEIYTRDYLDKKYHNCYRLFAIPAINYEDFHHGTSLARLCPITSLDDYDLYSEDVRNCTIPIDFTAWFDKFKKELIENYNFNFNNSNDDDDKDDDKNKKYFFYTSPAFPYINNHNFIKIRISKNNNELLKSDNNNNNNKQINKSKVCDLILHVKMASGAWMKNEVKSYELLDKNDHYEIILPYISTDSASKYELARLDANDFYIIDSNNEVEGNRDDNEHIDYIKLQTGIKAAFPKSIELIGIEIKKDNKKKKKGFLDSIKDLFGLTKNNNDKDKNKIHECSLNVETITIQPLKKIHRHFVASYSLNARDKKEPEIKILNENDKSPKIDLLHGESNSKNDNLDNNSNDNFQINSEIYIDTVIIGPHDNTIETLTLNENNDDDDDDDDDANKTTNQSEKRTTSSVSSIIWLILTISTIVAIIILSLIAIYKTKNYEKEVEPDKEIIIENDFIPSIDNL